MPTPSAGGRTARMTSAPRPHHEVPGDWVFHSNIGLVTARLADTNVFAQTSLLRNPILCQGRKFALSAFLFRLFTLARQSLKAGGPIPSHRSQVAIGPLVSLAFGSPS